jgi:hypothetical protein
MERARAWLEASHGSALAELVAMSGGGGARRYYRARFADGTSAVLMHALPEDPAILPPALRAASRDIPFLEVGAYLAQNGVPVPRVLAVERSERLVLLEDLGSRHLLDLTPAERAPRMREAIELLARVHALPRGEALPFRREFDAEWVRFELRTFQSHGLPERWSARLSVELDALAQAIAGLPRVLCLRDYQSQNLMVDPNGRLRVLDFQDALLAPPELDLAAFLFDSYIELDPRERSELLERYWRARGRAASTEAFALLVVQRKCKDLGRYLLLVNQKGDTRYAPFVARAREAVLGACDSLPAAQQPLGELLRAALTGVSA